MLTDQSGFEPIAGKVCAGQCTGYFKHTDLSGACCLLAECVQEGSGMEQLRQVQGACKVRCTVRPLSHSKIYHKEEAKALQAPSWD